MSDFMGFRFGPYHSSDLHLIVTSQSNRFNKNLLPSPNDYTLDIPGGDGKFYVGQTFNAKEIGISVIFTDMDEFTFRRLAQIFSTDKLQDLVFDEQPYKTYRAKCKSDPQFKFVCFKDPATQQRIYKGEGTINFVCYHPYAYCFNKYVVTAADYYKTTKPSEILNPLSINYNPYNHEPPPDITDEIKLHYNIDHNMGATWDGGYPTIEQVQWGELYYTDEYGKKQLITDVRQYWDNVPKWQAGAKLLTTPTLDYDQELIFMPQYSRDNYYNMETGLNKQNALIGSRILVYNPGDLPIDFKIYLNKINNRLRTIEEPYRFRISQYNVQRLTVEQAVDWINLKTFNEKDNEKFKYGKRYVSILETEKLNNSTINQGKYFQPKQRLLKDSHPNHLYFVEPIPKEQVVRYLKMFIYQTKKNLSRYCSDDAPAQHFLEKLNNFEVAAEVKFKEYETLKEISVLEEEQNKIYWQLLIEILKGVFSCFKKEEGSNFFIFENEDQLDKWLDTFLFNPSEFVILDKEEYSDTNEITYNAFQYLNYLPNKYIEIEANFIEDDEAGNKNINLIFDSEKRLLYNEIEEEGQFEKINKKIVYNEHIRVGEWFQIPTGWSVIEVTPVLLSDEYTGKRWKEARAFKWGTMKEEEKEIFEECEKKAIIDFLTEKSPVSNLKRNYGENGFEEFLNPDFDFNDKDAIREVLSSPREEEGEQLRKLESYIYFKNWFIDSEGYQLYASNQISIGGGFWKLLTTQIEIDFIKLLNNYWRLAHLNERGYSPVDAEDWWWYADNYIWGNFPPVYWGYVDILNEARIEYVPEYY